MEKNLEIKIAERDGTFIYALGPGGANSFQAHIQASGPDALTLEERQKLARMFAAAPETASERDRLRAVNAELVEALDGFVCYHSGHCCLGAQLNALMDIGRGLLTRARG